MNLIVNNLLQYFNDSLKVAPWIHIQGFRFFHIKVTVRKFPSRVQNC